MAGKIMSLWIYSSISEVSWEGGAVLTGCPRRAQRSGDLGQPVKGTSFSNLGKRCSSIAWWLGKRKGGCLDEKARLFLGWGFGVVLVVLQGRVWVAANFVMVGPAAPKKSGQRSVVFGTACDVIFLGLARRGSLSPPRVKGSGVACVLPQIGMRSVSVGI